MLFISAKKLCVSTTTFDVCLIVFLRSANAHFGCLAFKAPVAGSRVRRTTNRRLTCTPRPLGKTTMIRRSLKGLLGSRLASVWPVPQWIVFIVQPPAPSSENSVERMVWCGRGRVKDEHVLGEVICRLTG